MPRCESLHVVHSCSPQASGVGACAAPAQLPDGYLPADDAQAILDKTLRLHLDTDLSALSEAEQRALAKLIEAGPIFERLYEEQRHHEALMARAKLEELHESALALEHSAAVRDLYRTFKGPILTTLDNERRAMLPIAPERPGKNVYPLDADAEALQAFVESTDDALGVRTVVRPATDEAFERDLAALDRHPVLNEIHPDLRADLEQIRDDGEDDFYVLPYSVAYADDLVQASDLLGEAAAEIDAVDPEFADYLRKRAEDLLDDDYESGDAAWVTGRFGNLNAQIGAYETYADALYGVKSFFGMSLLLRDPERSGALESVTAKIQRLEDALPYAPHKKVREDIPVGVYSVIADWGEPRGTNTATILPNESHIARKYGRTILLRANIMTHPDIFVATQAKYQSAVAAVHADDLDLDGDFHYTLWHEIGHYLGPEETRSGELIDEALLDASDLLEEMKADVISLFAGRMLHESGYYDDASLRSLYAAGVERVLLKNRPRRDQPYGTMQLMQLNYFLENGMLRFDDDARLHVDYEVYHDVVAALVEEVLELQAAGDKTAVDVFVERWTDWDEARHGRLAQRLKDSETSRFRLVTYGALGE